MAIKLTLFPFAFSVSLWVLLLHCDVTAMPFSQTPSTLAHDPALDRKSLATSSSSVIIQMFQWDWVSIASECSTFIGPAGYGYVQVSPPQEHITGTQWWTDYQPVSYTLTSKRGNRAQFKRMIDSCHGAGVKVIVDTIFNHMTGANSGTGVAGHSFTHYSYPEIYEDKNFHHCGLTPNDQIVDYKSRAQVQTCQLDNLADLATESLYVRSRLAEYGNDLISLGVDGCRLDAAKHIATEDIADILSRLSTRPYISQEVIWGDGEAVQLSEYVDNGDVQEFRYTTALRNAFLGSGSGSDRGISGLRDLDDQGWISGTQANVFVANHDTERNGNSLNINSPSNTYILATIFSLAHPYGMPTVLSSYSFTNNDDGAPNGGEGTCSATGGSGGWLCQHRYIAFTGMVGFRNCVGSAAIVDWVSPGTQQIAFGRGSAGFVVINNMDSPWTTTFTTSLVDGTYCNVIAGAVGSDGTCQGPAIVVTGGSFTATINAHDALAIHQGAIGSTEGSPVARHGHMVSVTFQEHATTQYGENIFLVGSIPQLGNWNPNAALALSPETYPMWTVTVSLPEGTTFQYKFIRKESNGTVIWESDPNREATTVSSSNDKETLSSSWR